MSPNVSNELPHVFFLRLTEESGFRVELLNRNGECLGENTVTWDGRLARVISEMDALVQESALTRVDALDPVATQLTHERLGVELLNAVVGSTLADRLLEARRDGSFYLRLVIDAPQLRDIAWEALHDGVGFLGASGQVHVSRCLEVTKVADELVSPLRLSVLFVGAQLDDNEGVLDLAVGEERELIRRSLAAGQFDGRCVFRVTASASLSCIDESLKRYAPRIVHLSGHGQIDESSGAPVLILESQDGKADRVGISDLLDRCRPSPPDVLVLSNCHSAYMGSDDFYRAVLKLASEIGIPFIVGMRRAVSDNAATKFSEEFYRSLAAGASVSEATSRGRTLLLLADPDTTQWTMPVLYGSGILPDLRYRPSVAELTDRREEVLVLDGLPHLGADLVGRERDVRQIARLLDQPQVGGVLISGVVGQGKTALAIAVCNLLQDSYEAVIGLNCQEYVTVVELTQRLMAHLERRGLRGTAKSISGALRGKKVLLLLDSFDSLGNACDRLVATLMRCDELKCLLTSRIDLRFGSRSRAVETHRLGELDLRWVYALSAQLRGRGRLQQKEAGELHRLLGGHPLSHIIAAQRQRREGIDDMDVVARNVTKTLARDHEFRTTWTGLPARARRALRRLAVLPLPVDSAGVEQMVETRAVAKTVEVLEEHGLLHRYENGDVLIHRAAAASILADMPDDRLQHWRRNASSVLRRISQQKQDLGYGFASLTLQLEDERDEDAWPLYTQVINGYLGTGAWAEMKELLSLSMRVQSTGYRHAWEIDEPVVVRLVEGRMIAARRAERNLRVGAYGTSALLDAHTRSIAAGLSNDGLPIRRTLWEEALRGYESLSSYVGVRRCLSGLATLDGEAGQVHAALERAERAYHLAQQETEPAALLSAGYTCSRAYTDVGRCEDAIRLLEELLGVASQGLQPYQIVLIQALANVMQRVNRYWASRDLWTRALVLSTALDYREGREHSLYGLSCVDSRLGRKAEARRQFETVLESWRQQELPIEMAAALYELRLADGQRDNLDSCLDLARRMEAPRLMATVMLRMAWERLLEGNIEGAQTAVHEAPEVADPLVTAALAYHRAETEVDLATRRAAYEDAAERFRQAAYPLGVAAAMTRRGCVSFANEPALAVRDWHVAFAVLEGLGHRRASDIFGMLASGVERLGTAIEPVLAEGVVESAVPLSWLRYETFDADMSQVRAVRKASLVAVSRVEHFLSQGRMIAHALEGRRAWAAEAIREYRFDIELPLGLWNLPEFSLVASDTTSSRAFSISSPIGMAFSVREC